MAASASRRRIAVRFCVDGLAETDAGIEHDGAVGNPRALSDFDRSAEKPLDVLDDVERGVDLGAVVHDADRRAVLGRDPRDVGVALQPPDVVDDRGSGLERGGRDARFHRVDRDRRLDRPCSARIAGTTRRISSSASTGVWPGRVDSPPTSITSAPSASIARACATAVSTAWNLPAVRERVRRDVEDAHDARTAGALEQAGGGVGLGGSVRRHVGSGLEMVDRIVGERR